MNFQSRATIEYKCLVVNNSSNIDSSAIVEMSPKSVSLRMTFDRIRRIILPERVFGNALIGCITSGAANAPIFSRANFFNNNYNVHGKKENKFDE